MEAPQYVGSKAARMIAALSVFLGLVVVAVLLLTDAPGSFKEKTSKSKSLTKSTPQVAVAPPEEPASEDDVFFYDVVGQTPEAFGEEEPKAKAKANSSKVSYTLEIKVASSKDEAEQLIDLLKEQGVDAYYTPLTRAGKVVYRVRRGIFSRQKDAAQASLALKNDHNLTTKVVKLQ